MAKKKIEKSLEELLEEVFIKKDEQLYEVPGNWEWVKLEELFDITSSKRVFKTEWKSSGIPFYRAREIAELSFKDKIDNDLFISKEMYEDYSKKYGVPNVGDILITAVGTLGKVYIVKTNDKFYFKDGNVIWLKKKNTLLKSSMIKYFFESFFMLERIQDISTGTVVKTYTITKAKETLFPLPPLEEQKRIVKKLSSMLGRLKEARELIQEARDTFEERRAAILNKAFTGELTKKWREENLDVNPASMLLKEIRGEKKTPIRKNRTKENMPHTDISYLPPLPTKWEWAIVGEISDKIHYGYTAKSEGDPIGPKLLRITDIQNDTVDWNIVPYCQIDENQKTKYFLKEGDLVFARTGATVGKSYLLCGKFPESVFASYLIRIIINERVSNRYISNFFKSPSYWRQITSGQVGIGQPNVNAQTLSKIILPLPPFSEQKEIVRILEKLLDHENEARALIDMEEQVDLLEKSILSKAFRGELGTNDPDDKPAIELLKKSLKEKQKAA